MNSATASRKLFFALGVVLLAAITVPAVAGATNLFHDLFWYPNGNLTSNGGWYAHSGGGAKPIQVTNEAIVLLQGAGSGEDDNHPFALQTTTAKTYASFTLKVPVGSVMGTANEYFFHFRPAPTDTNGFVARTYVGPPTAGGDYVLGIATGSLTATPLAPWATGLTFGQTYKVVIAYDASTGTSTLWVDPVTELSTNVSSTSATVINKPLNSIAVRQASPAGATLSEVIDDVVVDAAFPAAPLPGMSPWSVSILAALLLLAGGAFVMRRRNTTA